MNTEDAPTEGVERIADVEQLARFIFYRDHVRASGDVKPDAFIPHPYQDLSVTRHAALSQEQIWRRGENVAVKRERELLGRADIAAATVRNSGLEPEKNPTAEDPEHAIIVGWASGKPNQKHQAQLLAKAAVYSRRS